MAKKYFSILNQGTQDLYVKDAEAQAALAEFNIASEADVRSIVSTYDSPGSSVATGNIVPVASGTTALSAEIGKYYRFGGSVGTLAITLPSVTGYNRIVGFMVQMTTGSDPAVTITATGNVPIKYYENFVVVANTSYELNFIYNGNTWVVAYGIIDES